jgi:hypothetical protein
LSRQADAQIHTYIRGKIAMSFLVGAATALSLGALSVDLWLVFGLLAFWLNFIPNVGTAIAVALPMPLVVLDPSFTAGGALLAFLLPLSAHALAGNVLEPVLFGHTLKLHPVSVLLSLLLWGTVWGVTGMVLAVPITAVLRIRLSHIQHPLYAPQRAQPAAPLAALRPTRCPAPRTRTLQRRCPPAPLSLSRCRPPAPACALAMPPARAHWHAQACAFRACSRVPLPSQAAVYRECAGGRDRFDGWRA